MFRTDDEARRKVLVSPQDLRAMIDGALPPLILVVQSTNPYTGLDSRDGRFIPGAVETEAYSDFQAPASDAAGARPLPEIAELQKKAEEWGVMRGKPIVVYDADRSMTAARAWWVLRWGGLENVRVLDGGLPAWIAAGYEVVKCPERKEKANVGLSSGHVLEFGASDAESFVREGVLLDARIRPNYIGGPEAGGNPKRGHIPGAISAPTLDTLTDQGTFADSATLAELFAGLGVEGGRPVGVYCGAGMSAAHEVLALAAIGIDASMYPGSWSQWVSDPARPVRRGAKP